MAALGLFGITVPETCGGAGADTLAYALVMEELARGLDGSEDLASPGVFAWTLNGRGATLVLAAGEASPELDPAWLIERETRRRAGFASPLQRAADAYVVQRGPGKTIVAGYPWFTDWGRDTLIALRGFMTLEGGLDLAQDILLAWAATVSEGMLPNRFPDSGEQPEYNAVDASLWYVIAAHEYLKGAGDAAEPSTVKALRAAAGSASYFFLAMNTTPSEFPSCASTW